MNGQDNASGIAWSRARWPPKKFVAKSSKFGLLTTHNTGYIEGHGTIAHIMDCFTNNKQESIWSKLSSRFHFRNSFLVFFKLLPQIGDNWNGNVTTKISTLVQTLPIFSLFYKNTLRHLTRDETRVLTRGVRLSSSETRPTL